MDKYYVPDSSEFYVGFEFEIFKDDKWMTTNFNIDDIIPVFARINDKTIISDKIRVKYLSKEDIESLGFNQISDDCFNMSNINYRGLINCDLRILIRKTALIYLIEPDEISHTLFTGNIKNKSELKKLLKQLEIG